MKTMKSESLIVNFLVRLKDFSVNSVLIVPTAYFLYSSTSGSMISNHIFGKKEMTIIAVYPYGRWGESSSVRRVW